jgi:hypothetical protein
MTRVAEQVAGRAWVRRGLALALFVQGASGVVGGAWLAWDPSGRTIGLPIEWLDGSPFPNYMLPGIILLTVLGLAPLLIARGVLASRPWSRPAAITVGLALGVWIGVEVAVIGYQPEPPLQLVYGLLAAVILGLGVFPPWRAATRA